MRSAAATRLRHARSLAAGPLIGLLCLLLAGPAAPTAAAPGDTVQLIVRGDPGDAVGLRTAIASVGGTVDGHLPVIDGVVATIPAGGVAALAADPAVVAATPDGEVQLQGDGLAEGWEDDGLPPFDADKDLGSLYHVTKAVGAHDVWSQHVTGEGVGVALIDSGVVPVEGLTGKVVNGPDLSFESQEEGLLHLDTYGHGTHMAGIIAGRDSDVQSGNEHDARKFVGVAPDAHIVNVKVATASGAVDVSQVIAAIDWVVEHHDDPDLNIRVLNLSFGTDTTQDPRLDPLSYAAEVAWRHGIVVVVSAGNDGGEAALRTPAANPFVIAVGAAHNNSTNSLDDDLVADFSNHGDASRRVDLVAPGKSIASLRAAGSASDVDFPGARVDERFFRGSGTSQAAAVVSGAVALLLEHRPELTPDQVKDLLLSTAAHMPHADPEGRGAGQLDVKRAKETPARDVQQVWDPGSGTGSLDLARGSEYVIDEDGAVLRGEYDIFGSPWDAAGWSARAATRSAWDGGTWNGNQWTGDCWCTTSWSGDTWSGSTWDQDTWSGKRWSGKRWSGKRWSGKRWSSSGWVDG